jgi:addiction module HigA family antidote
VRQQETAMTADTALRLARYFGTPPDFWLGIQALYDVEVVHQTLTAYIDAINPRRRRS